MNARHENRELSASEPAGSRHAKHRHPQVCAPLIRWASGVCVAFTEHSRVSDIVPTRKSTDAGQTDGRNSEACCSRAAFGGSVCASR